MPSASLRWKQDISARTRIPEGSIKSKLAGPRQVLRALSSRPFILVEYCQSCGYQPWAKLLIQELGQQLPEPIPVREAATAKTGAFEVSLCKDTARQNIWSKLLTGEPTSAEAIPAIAQVAAAEVKQLI
ncbi:hypothetical protein WJX84_009278 [Apatococcus fuscideae]|uniref:Uncharacterized protein n=1 Tax=Apatococcus fuscideae TaxID=2026836 RepID=A0AAW1S3Z2_9CHLO